MSLRVGVIGIAGAEVAELLRRDGGIEPVIEVDLKAAQMVAGGELDYVVGVCESGGGAALAIPIAILGAERCVNLSKLGRSASAEEIAGYVAGGRVAFGIARDHLRKLVPWLGAAISDAQSLAPPAS
jgi:Protein of unknown function DUF2620